MACNNHYAGMACLASEIGQCCGAGMGMAKWHGYWTCGNEAVPDPSSVSLWGNPALDASIKVEMRADTRADNIIIAGIAKAWRAVDNGQDSKAAAALLIATGKAESTLELAAAKAAMLKAEAKAAAVSESSRKLAKIVRTADA